MYTPLLMNSRTTHKKVSDLGWANTLKLHAARSCGGDVQSTVQFHRRSVSGYVCYQLPPKLLVFKGNTQKLSLYFVSFLLAHPINYILRPNI